MYPVSGGYGRGMFSMLRKVEEREVQGLAFPVTLGRDFSGVITQAGKGVTCLKAGDEVSKIILWESKSVEGEMGKFLKPQQQRL